jgi:hypothetical protein
MVFGRTIVHGRLARKALLLGDGQDGAAIDQVLAAH